MGKLENAFPTNLVKYKTRKQTDCTIGSPKATSQKLINLE
jgi:hypothetical protein